jgi:hypothetical protein
MNVFDFLSRPPMVHLRGAVAPAPSVTPIMLSPFWSIPRPTSGMTSELPSVSRIVSVPSGPNPFPATLMPIVAIPWEPSSQGKGGSPCVPCCACDPRP